MQHIFHHLTLLLSFLSGLLPLYATAQSESNSKAYFDLVGKSDKATADTRWDEAIEYLREAMRLEPSNPSNVLLLSNIGMLHHYAGRDTLSIEVLSEAHRQAPHSVTVLQNRAKVLTAMNRPKAALDDYTLILELDTTAVVPRYYHAMISLSLGLDSVCATDIDCMKRLAPDTQPTLLAEATYMTMKGRYAEAIPLLNKTVSIAPTAPDYATLAFCCLMTQQLAEASEAIARGLELDPTDGELYLYRAMLNKARFRPDDARADADKARLHGIPASRIKSLELD